MHIVHVVRQFHPAVGGFESVVFELAAAQVACGHAVRVVTLDRLFKAERPGKLDAREVVAGIEIVRIPFVGSPRYPIAPAVLRHIRDADIVHVHAIDFFFDYLAWTRPLHRKHLVVSTHGGFFHTAFAARLKRLYFQSVTRASMLWVDGVAAVSLTDERRFSAIRRHGLVCIENGVNALKFAEAGPPAPVQSMIWIGRFSLNKRLDRLISDISDASRLDAELQRQDMTSVDLRRLLNALTTVANETRRGNSIAVEVRFEGRGPNDTFSVPGHDSRLGHVISNLLSNAQSFSEAGGKVRIVCRRVRSEIEIVVDDDGPGIREDALERIFERFYTDRPHQGFGQNSGLGLSISKQIIEAHGGRIWAENRAGPPNAEGEATVAGARFVVRLPAP